MRALLAEIVPLALAAAVSPLVLLLQLVALKSARPLRHGSAFAAGTAVPLLLIAVPLIVTGRPCRSRTRARRRP